MNKMDENANVEVGECAQVNDKRSKFHGAVGRVERLFMRGAQEFAEVRLDAGIYRFRLKALIPRHVMACVED